MKYIWQLADFPTFKYNATKLLALVEESVLLIGEVRGIMKGFTRALQDEVSAVLARFCKACVAIAKSFIHYFF